MESKTFRFHPEAREDFRDAILWYRARSAIASVEFRKTVSGAIRNVVQAPQHWPKYLHGTRRFVLHSPCHSERSEESAFLATTPSSAFSTVFISVFI
jgi:plasmid stabilization system protein ParE